MLRCLKLIQSTHMLTLFSLNVNMECVLALFILLLQLQHFCQSSITPRTSFFIGSPGRVLSVYNTSDVLNTTTLLLSPDDNTLFVGVRDAVLSLDVSQTGVITLKHKYDWASPKTEKHRCPSDQLCANFIQVLQFINSTHLYVCGSYAYNPHDVILNVGTLSVIREPKNAKGHCPYSGATRNTAVFVDGELYTGTTKDYQGKEPTISRHLSEGRIKLESLPEFLKDPTFISSSYIPSEKKVLFFFTEEEAEGSFVHKLTVSRVAQVCTDDEGGQRVLQKSWTTFVKSQLKCQTNNQLPFGVLQDVVMVPPADDGSPDRTLFYGIFTFQWASRQSAVCVFTLKDIKEVFLGNYKSSSSHSPPHKADIKPGKCGLHNASDAILTYVKKTFLTDGSVQSVDQKQLLTTSEQQYSRITAQNVQAANGHNYTVLFLLSETGFLHKVVLLQNRPHIIEEIQVFKPPQTSQSILLSVTKGLLFVGFSGGVIQVPVSNCSFYLSCAECVLAQDPFCSWDSKDKMCILTSTKPNLHQDVENGNVMEQCEGHRARTVNYRQPVRHVVQVRLHKFAVLPCQSSSKQAQVTWRFSNHSIVPQSVYLQPGDGSLVFLVTPSTPQEFHCVTEEKGFETTASIFTLRVQDSAQSQMSDVRTGCGEEMELIPEVFYLNEDTYAKSYYNGMVVVLVLLVICLCVLVGVLWHSRRQKLSLEDVSKTEALTES